MIDPGKKVCSMCHLACDARVDFYRSGKDSVCRKCRHDLTNAWQKEHVLEMREWRRRYMKLYRLRATTAEQLEKLKRDVAELRDFASGRVSSPRKE